MCLGSRAGTTAALGLLPERAPLAACDACWLLGSTLQRSARSGPRDLILTAWVPSSPERGNNKCEDFSEADKGKSPFLGKSN